MNELSMVHYLVYVLDIKIMCIFCVMLNVDWLFFALIVDTKYKI